MIKTLKWIRNKFCSCCSDDYSKYTFERAPEPTDIYWENLPVSYWQRRFRILITYTCTVILIGICFGIIYGINIAKTKLNSFSDIPYGTIRGLSILASVIIVFINTALRTVVRELSLQERHETYTDYNLSVAFKLTLARFVNSSIVPIVVNLDSSRWFVDGGLVSDVFYIILSISFLDPILYVIDLGYFSRRIKRWI